MAVLVVDCGTSACRAVRYPLDGGPAEGDRREALPESAFGLGGAEIDPDALWQTVLRLLRWGAGEGPVEAIGFSTFFAYLFLGSDGTLLKPGTTWMDRRAAGEAKLLGRQLTQSAVHAATGRIPTGELLIPKMLHLRHEEPALFSRVATVVGLKDDMVRRLTGSVGTDFAHADYSLGYRPGSMRLYDEAWESAGIDSALLPPPQSAAAPAGAVTREAAAETGLTAGTPVVRGTTDGTAAMYGCGVLDAREGRRPGTGALVCGTTDVLMTHVSAESGAVTTTLADERITCNTAMAGGGLLAGGAMGMAGGAVDWLARTLAMTIPELEQAAAAAPAGSDGLLMVPSLTGERAPFWNETVAGTFTGIRPEHGAGHLFRACLEGSAVRLRMLADLIEEAGVSVSRFNTGGGSSGSALWNRIRADATGRPLVLLADPEATARGTALFCAAMLAGREDALFGLTPAWIRPRATVEPDPEQGARYEQSAARYREVMALYTLARESGRKEKR